MIGHKPMCEYNNMYCKYCISEINTNIDKSRCYCPCALFEFRSLDRYMELCRPYARNTGAYPSCRCLGWHVTSCMSSVCNMGLYFNKYKV